MSGNESASSRFHPVSTGVIQFQPVWSPFIQFHPFYPVSSSLIRVHPVSTSLFRFHPVSTSLIVFFMVSSSFNQFDRVLYGFIQFQPVWSGCERKFGPKQILFERLQSRKFEPKFSLIDIQLQATFIWGSFQKHSVLRIAQRVTTTPRSRHSSEDTSTPLIWISPTFEPQAEHHDLIELFHRCY